MYDILAIGLSYNTSNSICMYIAGCLHYFYLVAAFWLNVLHLDLCRVCFKRSILKKVSSNAREAKRAKFRFKLYSCYAWGIPILGLVWLLSFQLDFFCQPMFYPLDILKLKTKTKN